MEPFTITCSTCQSLIRVRNPKMIGQIANCPKCNSMIQIEEPRQVRVESHRGVIDSSALTKEAFAPELEDEYRLAPPDSFASPELTPGAAIAAPPRVDVAGASLEHFDEPFSVASPPVASKIDAASGTSSSNSMPSNTMQQLAVQRSARNRQALVVAVLGSAGVLLAGLIFTAFLLWYRNGNAKSSSEQTAAQLALANHDASMGPRREPRSTLDASSEWPSSTQLESASDTEADPAVNLTTDPAAAPEANTEGSPNEPSQAGATNNTSPTPTVPSESNGVGGNLAAALDNPANPNMPTIDTPPQLQPAAPEADPARPGVDLPEQLKRFENILNTVIEPQLVVEEAVQKAPPTAEELGLSTVQDSKATSAVNVAGQLQLELAGLVLPDKSTLSQTLNTWVAISGVPSAVNLDSLAAAGIDPHQLFGIKLVDPQPLLEIGQMIAQRMGVEFKVTDNQFITFEASENSMRERLPTAIEINDLVTDDEQQKWLIQTLNQFSPAHTDKWKISDGKLTVDAAEVDLFTWFWAVRMLETWRNVAGLATKLSELDQAKFVTHFVYPEKLSLLNQPLKVALLQREPVAQLLSELSAATQLDIWMDWPNAGLKGLGPHSLDMVVTQQRTARQCLRDIVDKYGLIAACENEQSVWLTTPASYRAQPRIYVLPSDGKTAEQWMDELQPLTPVIGEAVQPIQAVLTPDNRFVIVRCCRPRLRS